MKTALRKLSIAMLATWSLSSFAGSVAGTGGATEVTQLLNNVEMVNQTTQQIMMVQQQLTMLANQAKNLTMAPQQIWGQAQSDLMRLTSLVAQGQSIAYAGQNVDQIFKQRFPGYGSTSTNSNYGQLYRSWSDASRQGLSTALQAAGFQVGNFATEQAALQQIQGISAGSPGSLQAIQAGNMIASQQVEQLQKLRQLTVAQMEAQNGYLAAQQTKEDHSTEALDKWMRQGNGKVRDTNGSGFVGISSSNLR
jgi:P-type conjugative transfer protein TrbJ